MSKIQQEPHLLLDKLSEDGRGCWLRFFCDDVLLESLDAVHRKTGGVGVYYLVSKYSRTISPEVALFS